VDREYNYAVVRGFAISALVWGTAGMLAGLLAAAQLAWPAANLGLPWTTFGRIRPLHTNAVIFGFTLSSVFASIYYSTQRLCRVRVFSDTLSRIISSSTT
jgi:cytochrome c oxidase cbb3-type subunit 1